MEPDPQTEEFLSRIDSELSDEIMPVLRRIVRRFRADSSEVTAAQLGILKKIESCDRTTARELAQDSEMTSAAVSQFVSQLSRRGYVQTDRSARDRRVVELSLTNKGRRALRDARQRGRNIVAHLFRPLTGAEKKTLVTLLRKVRSAESEQ